MGGRGREQICAQPPKGTTAFEAEALERRRRLHRDQSAGKRLEWKETFDTGSAGRKGSLIRHIHQCGATPNHSHAARYI
ncbi:hypothetical protein GBF38_022052 [Nibea albiflora]|uniref:Uncharacterized protein n=1 Tax=Nibea albiflora TaxID=240163 RepID=A0ACB7FHG2_NIBAL|nr:hypothetical protein GBF38_022052 [Nibea albiflora]